MLADFADFTHPAHGALELGVVLGPIKRTLLERRAAVDRSVTGGAYLEFGKLVKLDVDGVVGVSLALSFRLLGLRKGALVSKSNCARRRRSRTYILNNLA